MTINDNKMTWNDPVYLRVEKAATSKTGVVYFGDLGDSTTLCQAQHVAGGTALGLAWKRRLFRIGRLRQKSLLQKIAVGIEIEGNCIDS